MAFHLLGDIFGVENGPVHRFTAEAIVETTVDLTDRQSVVDEEGGPRDRNQQCTEACHEQPSACRNSLAVTWA